MLALLELSPLDSVVCLSVVVRESDQRCPIDNMPITESQLFPDNFAKREILGLSVKCPNSKEGCQVIETLKNIQV